MTYRRTYLVSRWDWYLTHPWEYIHSLYGEIKAFLQRGYRGYANCDTWSFHSYLSEVINGGLKILKEEIHGCPGQLVRHENGEKYQTVEEGCKEWGSILQKMIDAFELDIKEDSETNPLLEEEQKRRDEGKQLFIKWYGNLWD